MAPNPTNVSPPPQTTATSQKGHTESENSKQTHIRRKIKRGAGSTIKPTEVVAPEATDVIAQDRNQAMDVDTGDSSDADDATSIELSEYEDEEDEYDEGDEYDEDDEEDDDAESIYLSDPNTPEESTTQAIIPFGTRRSLSSSASAPTSTTRRSRRNTSQPINTFVETRTQTTQWMVAQQRPNGAARDVTITRGTTTSRQQTVHQQFHATDNSSRQENGISRGNSLRFNMSLNLNVQFSGLVSGRNLTIGGGQLSYGWGRGRQG